MAMVFLLIIPSVTVASYSPTCILPQPEEEVPGEGVENRPSLPAWSKDDSDTPCSFWDPGNTSMVCQGTNLTSWAQVVGLDLSNILSNISNISNIYPIYPIYYPIYY